MFLLRNVLCIVISLTAICVALNENHDNANAATSLSATAVGAARYKRGVDVAQLLRNILLQSAQASDFKANITRAAARTTRRPTTARPRPPPPPPPPRRMPDPFNIFAFKNKFIPFNPIDYGDYDDAMQMPQTPAPRPRPRPRPSPATTMAPPTTAAPPPPPPPPPRPRPMPRRRPPPPPPPPARPIHRFGNLPFGADYDYFQYANQGLGGDYDYEQDQQPPAPQPPPAASRRRPAASTAPAAAPRRRPASPPPQPPPPAATPPPPRRPPSQLRNRVAYQFAQPADPSYDDTDPNAEQDDAVDYADVATPDDSNSANDDAAAPADPGVDADNADNAADANPPNNNNDDAADANADDQSAAQLPQIPPGRPQQQQDFSSFDYDLGSKGGVGPSSLSYVPQQGSYEFRNQFANFKTNFDGDYPKPSYNDGQYYSYYQ